MAAGSQVWGVGEAWYCSSLGAIKDACRWHGFCSSLPLQAYCDRAISPTICLAQTMHVVLKLLLVEQLAALHTTIHLAVVHSLWSAAVRAVAVSQVHSNCLTHGA